MENNDIVAFGDLLDRSIANNDKEFLDRISVRDYIIKLPSNIFIPPAATKIHGINREISNEKGITIKKALKYFTDDLMRTNFLVAHNINFDVTMLSAEYHRNKQIDWIGRYRGRKICTMKLGNAICNIKYYITSVSL